MVSQWAKANAAGDDLQFPYLFVAASNHWPSPSLLLAAVSAGQHREKR
jgi:hypothetical protein